MSGIALLYNHLKLIFISWFPAVFASAFLSFEITLTIPLIISWCIFTFVLIIFMLPEIMYFRGGWFCYMVNNNFQRYDIINREEHIDTIHSINLGELGRVWIQTWGARSFVLGFLSKVLQIYDTPMNLLYLCTAISGVVAAETILKTITRIKIER